MFIIGIDVVVSTTYAHIPSNPGNDISYIFIKVVIFIAYFAEGLVIFLANGPKKSMRNGYFLFNSVIFVISLVELLIYLISRYFYIGLSVVRAVGLIQVFRQTRFWDQLSAIISSFVDSIKGVSGLVGLLSVVLTNYALLGNQLFGRPDLARDSVGTFDNFGSSLLLSFVLLTGDNWTTIMVENMTLSSSLAHKIVTVIFFLSFVVVGNFILMNVFLGIIVDNLASDLEEHDTDEPKKVSLKTVAWITTFLNGTKDKVSSGENVKGMLCCTQDTSETNHMESDQEKVSCPPTTSSSQNCVEKKKVHFDINSIEKLRMFTGREKRQSFAMRMEIERRARVRALSLLLDPEIANPMPQHKSLFLFSERNKFRKSVFAIVTSSNFTILVCFAVVLSSCVMAFDDPLNEDNQVMKIMEIFEYVFTG